MRACLLAVGLVCSLAAGCSAKGDGAAVPATKYTTEVVPKTRIAAPARFAQFVDQGALLAYDRHRTAPRSSGSTWHAVRLSEAHALQATESGVLTLDAPDGTTLRLRHVRHLAHGDGNWTFVGRPENGSRDAEAVLTFGEHAAFGTIPGPNGSTLSLTTVGGQAWLVENDPGTDVAARAANPDFAIAPPNPAAALQATSPAGRPVTGLTNQHQALGATAAPASAGTAQVPGSPSAATTIDVVVGYTAGFATRLGGDSQALTRLAFLVDLANQAYANSQVDLYLRMVRAVRVDYPDATNNRTALYELTGVSCSSSQTGIRLPDRGVTCTAAARPAALEPLITARRETAADLVTLVRTLQDPEQGSCGTGWLLGGGQGLIDTNSIAFGMSVVSDSSGNQFPDNGNTCRDDYLAHELGHNMGLQHDRETAQGTDDTNSDGNLLDPEEYGRHPFSFGYSADAANGNFSTVMAVRRSGQSTYLVFSNPRISSCGGFACGVANVADNARSLTLTSPIIAAFGNPQEATRARHAPDLDGDGKADILWRNTILELMAQWLMDGATLRSERAQSVSSLYKIVGNGDFDGDGRDDILWSTNANDRMWIWRSRGDGTYEVLLVGAYGPDRIVAAVTDINGDGRDDIVWRHGETGGMSYWLMNGATPTPTETRTVAAIYRIVGAGDFDGDGRGDLLWTNDTSDLLWVWRSRTDGAFDVQLVDGLPPDWRVTGVTDIDNDSHADIVLRNPVLGLMAHWRMNGSVRIDERVYGVASIYRIIGTGDFDGDRRGDLLWTNETNDLLWQWRSVGDGTYQVLLVNGYPPGWVVSNGT